MGLKVRLFVFAYFTPAIAEPDPALGGGEVTQVVKPRVII
jgi:hypothetical protein